MKKNLVLLNAMLIVVGVLVGCSSLQNKGDSQQNSRTPFEDTEWSLLYYRKSSVIEGTNTTAVFENGQVSGSAGCNQYFGSYEKIGEKEGVIKISQLASTEMFCMDPDGVMEQEAFFLESMADGVRYEILENHLKIIRADGETLTFKAE